MRHTNLKVLELGQEGGDELYCLFALKLPALSMLYASSNVLVCRLPEPLSILQLYDALHNSDVVIQP